MDIKTSNCVFLGRRLLRAVPLRGVSPVLDRMLAEFALRHERLALAVEKRKEAVLRLRDSRQARDAVHRLCLDCLQRAWNRIDTAGADVFNVHDLGSEAVQELRQHYFRGEPPNRAGLSGVGLVRVLTDFVAAVEAEGRHPELWPEPFLRRIQDLPEQYDQVRKEVSAALAEARAARVEMLQAREPWLLYWKMLQPAAECYLTLGGRADAARGLFELSVSPRSRKRVQATGPEEAPKAPPDPVEKGEEDDAESEVEEEPVTNEDLEREDAPEEPSE